MEELCRAFASALLHGDEVAAEVAIREAVDARLTTAQIDDEVIAPAMWLVGRLWERGEISVADEHLATEIVTRVVALQREVERVAVARGQHRVMLAAPSGEQHVLALRMTGNLLRGAGYAVVMLGADVPAPALAAAAERHQPAAICVSATMPGGDDQVLVALDAVRAFRPDTAFVVGGQGITSRLRGRPALDTCLRVGDVVEAVDAMVQRASLN